MLAVGAAITGFLFYIDDWEEKHASGYKSTDSIQLLIGVFTFYTLIFTVVFGGIIYIFAERYLNQPNKPFACK